MSWPRVVCLLSALPFAGIGLAFVSYPDGAASLVGLELTNVTADNDVRAVYGGLSLGCAALLAWCAADEARVAVGVHAQVFTFAGLVAGRFVSIAMVGMPEAIGLALHGAEIVGLGCGLSALHSVRSSHV